MKLFLLLLFVSTQARNLTACTETQYFDTITLLCKECQDNQIPFKDIGCQCEPNFQFVIDQIGFIQGADKENPCLPCTVEYENYNVIQDCTCPEGQAISRHNENGSFKTTLECITCSSNAFINDKQECERCPHDQMTYQEGECVCNEDGYVKSQNSCVADADFSQLGQNYKDLANNDYDLIDFTNYIGTGIGQIRSKTYKENYVKAAVGCKVYHDSQSCQQLANLCILTIDMNSIACELYQSIVSEKTHILPDLFYGVSGKVAIEETKLKMLMSFKEDKGSQIHNIKYFILEYSLDGKVIGDIRPIANELILCSNSVDDAKLMSRFGIEYSNNCELDLQKYVTNYETSFYQIWIQDIDESLVPIPVLITELRDKRGEEANVSLDKSDWQFVSRLFTVDNQAGFESQRDFTSVVRYARRIKFSYLINNDEEDKIFLPYITVTYLEKAVEQGEIADPMVPCTFDAEYAYDPSRFYIVAGILIIVVHCIIFVIWVARVWIWTRNNPSYIAPETWSVVLFLKAIQLLIDTWAEGMFYYLFFTTGYWFCFFKFQESIYVLMPSMDDYYNNYRPYEIIFYMMFAVRFLCTIFTIYGQADLEIFFVDWEKTEIWRPQDLDTNLRRDVVNEISKYNSKVSIWRTLLIANEFNELQTFRIVSVEWTILFTGLFLIGLSWQDLAALAPNVELNPDINQNYILRYFITNFVFMSIGLFQIIVRKLFDIWFPIAIEDFVDLCSIANISILIMDDVLHGYYIHGENPIGWSEGSAEHLQNCLFYESLGKGKKRGFVQSQSAINPEDDELQTFEIFLSLRFRESYDKVFKLPTKELTDAANNEYGYQNISIFTNPTPLRLDMQKHELNRQKLLFYLKDVLNQIRSNPTQYIRNKLRLQRFLSFPPPDLENPTFKEQNHPVFFSILINQRPGLLLQVHFLLWQRILLPGFRLHPSKFLVNDHCQCVPIFAPHLSYNHVDDLVQKLVGRTKFIRQVEDRSEIFNLNFPNINIIIIKMINSLDEQYTLSLLFEKFKKNKAETRFNQIQLNRTIYENDQEKQESLTKEKNLIIYCLEQITKFLNKINLNASLNVDKIFDLFSSDSTQVLIDFDLIIEQQSIMVNKNSTLNKEYELNECINGLQLILMSYINCQYDSEGILDLFQLNFNWISDQINECIYKQLEDNSTFKKIDQKCEKISKMDDEIYRKNTFPLILKQFDQLLLENFKFKVNPLFTKKYQQQLLITYNLINKPSFQYPNQLYQQISELFEQYFQFPQNFQDLVDQQTNYHLISIIFYILPTVENLKDYMYIARKIKEQILDNPSHDNIFQLYENQDSFQQFQKVILENNSHFQKSLDWWKININPQISMKITFQLEMLLSNPINLQKDVLTIRQPNLMICKALKKIIQQINKSEEELFLLHISRSIAQKILNNLFLQIIKYYKVTPSDLVIPDLKINENQLFQMFILIEEDKFQQ